MYELKVLVSRGLVLCLFKRKTAYEVRISYGSSDVCSSDLSEAQRPTRRAGLLIFADRDAAHRTAFDSIGQTGYSERCVGLMRALITLSSTRRQSASGMMPMKGEPSAAPRTSGPTQVNPLRSFHTISERRSEERRVGKEGDRTGR